VRLKLLAGLVCAGACFAQHYEIGGAVGYGVYHDGSIISSGGTADAGIRNGLAAGAVFSEDLYQHFSGEVRYLYHSGDTFLSAGSAKGTVQGQSHALHYDMLFHLKPRRERIRPYAAAGVGAKFYENTGPAPVPQPLPNIAALSTRSEWKPLFTVGGGVKIRISDRLIVRGDIRDYITMFPKALFTPVSGASDRGFFHQFTPLFGLGYTF
jgi:opacity protein-like surface antigen